MNREKFFIEGNIFFEDNNLLIKTPAKIKNFLVISNLIILLINSDDFKDDRNILCYTLEGKLKWQIEEITKLHFRNYYTSIYLNNNDFKAYNLNGIEATIDLNTGMILSKELIK